MSTPTVSVVMPVYNEKKTLEAITRRVLASPLVTELIMVDDGSTDGTRELIEKISAPPFDPQNRVRAVLHPQNRGKGAALRTGFEHAKGDIIIVQDADLEYDPADYPILLKPIFDGRADVVYGSRFLGGPHRVHLFWHYVGNKALTILSNILTNINLTDMETCYKVFKRDLLPKLNLNCNDFGFEVEFTIKVSRLPVRIYEAPISYSGRGYDEGKKITWKDGIRALRYLIRYRFFEN